MSAGSLFFAVCGLVCLVGALVTVLAQNPIRGAMGLLATILGIAGLFMELHAQFLAAIQLIVYAGAVIVLFVFVIMLLGPDAGSAGPGKARASRWFGGGLTALLSGAALYLAGAHSTGATVFLPARPEHGTVEAVGGMLFGKGLVPFELATALLIVAVVGAIAVARSQNKKKIVEKPEGETRRMFVGPLHPRDAGHPIEKEPAE
jgi:NADH-quinone oxidoreductase subunit J